MPITLSHQPEPAQVGRIANLTGLGRYRERRADQEFSNRLAYENLVQRDRLQIRGIQGNLEQQRRGAYYTAQQSQLTAALQARRDQQLAGFQEQRDFRLADLQGARDEQLAGFQGARDERLAEFQAERDNILDGLQRERDDQIQQNRVAVLERQNEMRLNAQGQALQQQIAAKQKIVDDFFNSNQISDPDGSKRREAMAQIAAQGAGLNNDAFIERPEPTADELIAKRSTTITNPLDGTEYPAFVNRHGEPEIMRFPEDSHIKKTMETQKNRSTYQNAMFDSFMRYRGPGDEPMNPFAAQREARRLAVDAFPFVEGESQHDDPVQMPDFNNPSSQPGGFFNFNTGQFGPVPTQQQANPPAPMTSNGEIDLGRMDPNKTYTITMRDGSVRTGRVVTQQGQRGLLLD